MAVLFLKENIIKSRQNDNTGKNALKLIRVDKQNEFLFKKNTQQFLDLIDFLIGRDDVFALTGFSLSGKTLMTSVIPQMIIDKTVFYSFKCTPSSSLDDLLLAFFEVFKVYVKKGLLHLPKIETKNFQERINIYLTKCENPIIIVLDGLNEIADEKNKNDIMNFLSQVVNIENIKLIINSRSFEVTDLKNINLRLKTSIIKPLTLDDLKTYCLNYIINSEGIDEFFKLSHGHYFNLCLTMSYLQPTNLTIKEFLAELKTTSKSIRDVIISKNLYLVPQSYSNLLWILSSVGFGIPKGNLLALPDVEEEQILFLQKKGIVEIISDIVYIRDFYKAEILKNIEPLAQINIIKGLIKFLESQLPLKPSIRELKLSRVTMQNEIQRLNKIINKDEQKKKDADKPKSSNYMSILGYSKQFKTSWDGIDEIIMPNKEVLKIKNSEQKEKIEEINIEDLPKVTDEKFQPELFETDDYENDAFSLAKRLMKNYSYAEALVQYADALSFAVDNHNDKMAEKIYKDIAKCYVKIGDYDNAINNYAKAHEYARKIDDISECYAISLKVAEIYKLTYKKELATEIYIDILEQEGLDPSIVLDAELNLFEINFSGLKPTEIFDKYYELLEKAQKNRAMSAKIHFRLGFLYDKASSFTQALKHYSLSIEACDDCSINENVSSCYYNMAEIYLFKKSYELAIEYYLKSYAADKFSNNLDGQIVTVKKIAIASEKIKASNAVNYFEQQIELAKLINDNYLIACAYIDLGDYYYRQKQDMKALKIYMSAKKTLNSQMTKENELAIKDRINDLKVRMGKDVVEKILKEFY